MQEVNTPCEANEMPKKPQKSKPRNGDRHRSKFVVRLPDSYKPKFQEYKKKTGCPFSEAARRAMDAFLMEAGIEPPPEEQK